MKKIIFYIIIIVFSASILNAENNCILKVKLTNFRSTNNNVILYLFDDNNTNRFSDGKYAIKKLICKVNEKAMVLNIPNLQYGKYAIAVLHDEDNNGEMTTGLFGLPKEGYGYSNDAKPKFGPPKFEEASFVIIKNIQEISIDIKYF